VDKTGLGAVLASLVLCLPCLLGALAAAGGVALASGAAAWVADNAVIAVAGLAAAVAVGAAIVAYRRRGAAGCDVEPILMQETKVGGSRR
jgi:hypothetical protein